MKISRVKDIVLFCIILFCSLNGYGVQFTIRDNTNIELNPDNPSDALRYSYMIYNRTLTELKRNNSIDFRPFLHASFFNNRDAATVLYEFGKEITSDEMSNPKNQLAKEFQDYVDLLLAPSNRGTTRMGNAFFVAVIYYYGFAIKRDLHLSALWFKYALKARNGWDCPTEDVSFYEKELYRKLERDPDFKKAWDSLSQVQANSAFRCITWNDDIDTLRVKIKLLIDSTGEPELRDNSLEQKWISDAIQNLSHDDRGLLKERDIRLNRNQEIYFNTVTCFSIVLTTFSEDKELGHVKIIFPYNTDTDAIFKKIKNDCDNLSKEELSIKNANIIRDIETGFYSDYRISPNQTWIGEKNGIVHYLSIPDIPNLTVLKITDEKLLFQIKNANSMINKNFDKEKMNWRIKTKIAHVKNHIDRIKARRQTAITANDSFNLRLFYDNETPSSFYDEYGFDMDIATRVVYLKINNTMLIEDRKSIENEVRESIAQKKAMQQIQKEKITNSF